MPQLLPFAKRNPFFVIFALASFVGIVLVSVGPPVPSSTFCLLPATPDMGCISKEGVPYQSKWYFVAENQNVTTCRLLPNCWGVQENAACASGSSIQSAYMDGGWRICPFTHTGDTFWTGELLGAVISFSIGGFFLLFHVSLNGRMCFKSPPSPQPQPPPSPPQETHPLPIHIRNRLVEADIEKGRTYECPICLEKEVPPANIHITGCGHEICKECFQKQLESKSKCPVCRADL